MGSAQKAAMQRKRGYKLAGKNLFYYLNGLGNLPNRAMFRVELDGDTLILSHASPRAFRKDKIIQQYKIAASDILAFDIVTEAELKNRSVVGRGVAGGLLFGPVGAVLGGLSGSNKQKIKATLAISYLPSSGGDPLAVVFDAEPPSWGSQNKLSVIKNKLVKIPKSGAAMAYLGQTISADGSIILLEKPPLLVSRGGKNITILRRRS